jgi:hypothetical protein
MTNQEIFLELENRKKIYDLISNYPGLHLRLILRKINLSSGTVRYHMHHLKKRNLIKETYKNGYKRYFTTENISNESKKLISLLRETTPKHIILFLLFGKTATKKQLAKELNKTPETIEYYLKKLRKENLIKKGTVEKGIVIINHGHVEAVEYNGSKKENVYILSDYPLINDFFIVNKNWFSDKITKEIIKMSIECEKKIWPKKMKSYDSRTKKYIKIYDELILEIFPHPYYI